jgi:hypothetical protein
VHLSFSFLSSLFFLSLFLSFFFFPFFPLLVQIRRPDVDLEVGNLTCTQLQLDELDISLPGGAAPTGTLVDVTADGVAAVCAGPYSWSESVLGHAHGHGNITVRERGAQTHKHKKRKQ